MKPLIAPLLIQALIAVLPAKADVNLTVVTNSFTVTPGESFSLGFDLVITGNEEVVGLDYFLKGSVSGLFTLTSRNLSGSVIADSYPFSSHALNPSSTNLGGLTPMDVSLFQGTHFLGNYTFTTSPSFALGSYSLVIDPGKPRSWLTPDFDDIPFASLPTITVNVVPEPAAWVLLGSVAVLFAATIRRAGRER